MRLRQHLDRIGHIQFAAVPSRAEPDEGELDYPAIFAEMTTRLRADGSGASIKPRGDTDAGLAWVSDLGVRLTPPEVIVP